MNEYQETLFKKDSKGKLRTVNIYTDSGIIYQISGLIGGEKVTHESTCKGKNIGKSNETTPEQQAVLEAKAKVAKKINEGYFLTEEEAENNLVILPMLAHSFDKHEKKVIYPCYVQRKYDGMRMLAIKKNGKVSLISRKNKEITTLDHIKRQLEDPSIPDYVYDGEAYNLEIGTFQEQMKAIKKVGLNTSKINFNIYDIIIDKPFKERNALINKIFSV